MSRTREDWNRRPLSELEEALAPIAPWYVPAWLAANGPNDPRPPVLPYTRGQQRRAWQARRLVYPHMRCLLPYNLDGGWSDSPADPAWLRLSNRGYCPIAEVRVDDPEAMAAEVAALDARRPKPMDALSAGYWFDDGTQWAVKVRVTFDVLAAIAARVTETAQPDYSDPGRLRARS